MKCSECKGTGKYAPLFGEMEDCRACDGTGNVLPNGGGVIPAEFASDESVVNNTIVWPSVATRKTRRDIYLWLAQRWDAAKMGLVAGKFYIKEPGQSPIAVQPTTQGACGFDIDNQTLEVYRQEFPSSGFQLHCPGDPDWATMQKEYGSNPCVERGVLFIGFNATIGRQVEFFASEDSMGISFVTAMSGYRLVTLDSRFDSGASMYLPIITVGKP